MLSNLIEDFYSKSINLDCAKITLKKKHKTKPLIYTGPGEIRQNSDGDLEFKLFVTRNVRNEDLDGVINPEIKLGEIIPESYYYNFKALDFNGNEWFCPKVEISPNISLQSNSIVITGSLYDITIKSNSKIPVNRANFLYLKKDLEFSFNKVLYEDALLNGKISSFPKERFAEINASNYKLTVKKENKYISVKIDSLKSSINEFVFWRLFESFQFIYSSLYDYLIYSFYFKNRLTIKFHKTFSGNNDFSTPPVESRRLFQKPDVFWNLFSSYFNFSIKNKKLNYSPLFRQLYSIYLTSDSTINIQSLILTISIDNVIKQFFPSKQNLSKKEKLMLADLNTFISKANYTVRFKERVTGVFSILHNVNSKKILQNLRKQYAINENEIKKYYKLRQKTVHFDKESQNDMSKMLDLYYSSLVLFYKLIFIIINYNDLYIDYSEKGLPLKSFIKR